MIARTRCKDPRFAIHALAWLAAALAACTADLVPVPMQTTSERPTPRTSPPASGAAGARSGPAPARSSDPGSTVAPERDAGPSVPTEGVDGDDAGTIEREPPSDDRAPDAASPPIGRAPEPEPEAPGPETRDPEAPAPEAPDPDTREPEPPPPAADSCITSTAAADHLFRCGSLFYLVRVDPACAAGGCGLIVDIHGNGMGAPQMRDATGLHELAAPHRYVVVHPSPTPERTGGTWSEAMYPELAAFVRRLIDAFRIDDTRVHAAGYAAGAEITFWMLCNQPGLIASAAAAAHTTPDADCIGLLWNPRVPILYMHGREDVLTLDAARRMVDDIVDRLLLRDDTAPPSDEEYTHARWTGRDMQLDYIEHRYTRMFAAGHCLPGGADTPESSNNLAINATTCTMGDIRLHWGELALQWFRDHPRGTASETSP